MSLTSHLKNPNSPVRRFFDLEFPELRRFNNAWAHRVKGLDTLSPQGPLDGYPWAAVGRAVDYRIRRFFEPYKAETTVAAIGARYGCLFNPETFKLITTLWESAAKEWDGINAIEPTDSDTERRLLRLCMVFSEFETMARTGDVPFLIRDALSFDDLLSRSPDYVIDDLHQLAGAFRERNSHLIKSGRVKLNPLFSGSSDVSGADGDVIVDGIIWEFKTTLHPERPGTWAYQLLGYGLLDYHDEYRLKGAGVYLVRQSVLIDWTWEEMFQLLGTTKSLEELRSDFYECLNDDPFPERLSS